MIAPVRVARSITPAGSKRSCAYHSRSHSTSRPSASVLITSTVSPFIVLTMSPGRWARPSGMFSTSPTRPTTLALALRSARAFITPATVPAPPMSMVISSMPWAGLIEMPPVSNTTPLPTSASGFSPFFPPCHCMTTTFEGLSEPCPTASSARMPSFSSAASSSTSTFTPSFFSPSRRRANSAVVSTLAGSLTRSRVKNTPSASAATPAAASRASSGRVTMIVTAPSGLPASSAL